MAKEKSQMELASSLQIKLLKYWEKALDNGTLTPTDAATLTRFLMANGWNVDPAKVPARLKDILTKSIDATKLDEDEAYQ